MAPFSSLRKLLRPARRTWNTARDVIFGTQRDHLARCHGVIHVGANDGLEPTADGRAQLTYADTDLLVVWIEPIPEVYRSLTENIAAYPKHTAIQALISDADGDERILHVANNQGLSSSIFDLHLHRDIWPHIGYVRDIPLRTETLSMALERAGVRVSDYDALVLDTQGSELLILKGAARLLPQFRYIVTEAADFEGYKGGATLDEIKVFLRPFGFKPINYALQAVHPSGGRSYDVLFRRR
jgi:FkbM family methyltransferase